MGKTQVSFSIACMIMLGWSYAHAQSTEAPPPDGASEPGDGPSTEAEPPDRHPEDAPRDRGEADVEFTIKANQAIEQTKQALKQLLEQSEQAAEQAKKASDYDQAVLSVERARQILYQARESRDLLNAQMAALGKGVNRDYDKTLKEVLDEIQGNYDDAAKSRDARKSADEALCGTSRDKTPAWMCFYYGAYTASLSRVNVAAGRGLALAGQSSHQIVSVAVPAVGVRLLRPETTRFVSLDVGAYSAAISPTFNGGTSSDPAPCRVGASEFEKRLPCEGDAPVVPYVAGYLGVTVGKSGIGYLSVIPFTVGVANVG